MSRAAGGDDAHPPGARGLLQGAAGAQFDRTLFACDAQAGFLTACALVKPSKALAEVEAKGVLKKMQDKGFARAVKREDMSAGAEMWGLSLEEHVQHCLEAMQERARRVGFVIGLR